MSSRIPHIVDEDSDVLSCEWLCTLPGDHDCYKVMLASGRADAVAFYERVGLIRSRKNFFEARKE
jgi:hypothetical protein